MAFRRKPALTARDIWILVGIGAATLIIASTLIGADILLSREMQGGGKFLSAWAGARAVLWQGADPYGSPVVRLTQQLVYDRPADPGEDQFIPSIPLPILLLYFPFALTPSASIARGLWMALSQAALVGTAFLAMRLIEWKASRAYTVLYSVLGVFGLYAVMAWLSGSPSALLGLLYVGALLAYSTERDEVAGALLALCLFDWEVGGPFILLFILRIFGERRWNVVAGAAMLLVVLGVLSFLVFPGWVIPFLAATVATARASFGISTAAGLNLLFPGHGALAVRILALLVAVALVFEWAAGRGGGLRRFIWTACFALAAAPLLGFRTELANLVVLLPAVGLFCATALDRQRSGGLLAAGFLFICLLLPWYLFGRWLARGDAASESLLLLVYPLLTIIGLYWIRWWFIRPGQTWLDQVRSAGGTP